MRGGRQPVFTLDSRTITRFIGDLHLGDGGRNDSFGGQDDRLVQFLADCEGTCDAVVFMDDAFDLPQAFAVRRICRRHPRVIEQIQRLAKRIQVVFLLGNHDWTVAYEQLFPEARVSVELAMGEIRAMHGHQLDRYSRPERPGYHLKMSLHHLAERVFGFEFRVPLWEHDSWQNRVAHWLGVWYGYQLRRAATLYRFLGLAHRAAECDAFIEYWSRALWGDPHALFEPVRTILRDGPYRALVCGHTHVPGVVGLDGRCYANAGSWAFGRSEYVEWDGRNLVARSISGEEPGDRRYRWLRDREHRGDVFEWWARHYKGWFRFEKESGTNG